MRKVLHLLICYFLFVSCNNQIKNIEQIEKNYLSKSDLVLKYSNLQKTKLIDLDSIYKFELGNDNTIIYSKYDWNKGIIALYNNNQQKIIEPNFIDIKLFKLTNNKFLLKILESNDEFVKINTYILMQKNLEIQDKISVISEGVYLLPEDTITGENIIKTIDYQLIDSITPSKIYLKLLFNGTLTYDTIQIKEKNFKTSQKIDTIKWSNLFILQRNYK